ncbi:glycosyltransferase involved in cell wall biosynthesis [Rhizomicrobium palustre]|uniref:Glycosyltransferase involved in cell wall biosynthesis n=1 Tax=Rhizomicrobium palustre TaxID=189966 RepID=A0A846MV18_9PROT|nr:glycosyltransferase family 1 protein [Rhizomicrobium palustre]NIK86920.1 glycosyltransferase involved in cell wall biosynthesis [Rhizomicrobium palustre]
MSTALHLAVDARMIAHTGIGTYLRNVLTRLVATHPDWRFHLVGDPAKLGIFAECEQVKIHPCTVPIYGIHEQLWWAKARIKADLLWVPHYNVPLAWRGRLAATVHDMAHLRLAEITASLPRRLYAKTLMHAVKTKTAGLIFVSKFTAGEFRELVGEPRAGYRIIAEGVDEEWYSPIEKTQQSDGYVVFVGNAKQSKNLTRLLKAFARIQDQISQKLLIIGQRGGFLTGATEVDTLATQLGARIEFAGRVDDPALRKFVANADLLVMPSLYEGFGLPVVEAMACGCPVLSSSAASLPEVGGEAVIYCDPMSEDDIAAKLLAVLKDSELRAILSRKGLARAAQFDWNKVAAETGAYFAEICA